MTRFMTTTAVAAALMAGSGAIAQNAIDASGMFRTEADAQEIQASEFLGMRVYAAQDGVGASDAEGLQVGWDDVGEINDIIIGRDGSVEAVLVDLGGFLGMGERQVALNMDAINFVSDAATEDQSDFFLVIPASRADLENAPEYVDATAVTQSVEGMAEDTATAARDAGNEMMQAADEAGDEMAQSAEEMAEDTGTAARDVGNDMMQAGDEAVDGLSRPAVQPGAIVRDGFDTANVADLTADDLTGARVYDSNDEWIGEVEQLLLADTGEIEGAVIDVGGFLGLGEKPVELAMDELDVLQERDGGTVRVFVAMTKDQLESMPSYEE